MENGELPLGFSVLHFWFIGCYFLYHLHDYAVGCDKVKSNINYNSQVPSVTTRKRVAQLCLLRLRRVNRMCSSTLSVNCEKVEKDTQE